MLKAAASILCPVLCLALSAAAQTPAPSQIDKDLYEASIAQIHDLYASHKYTVTQVVQWHLARIHKYNGIYRPVEQILEKQALAVAKQEDREAAAVYTRMQRAARSGGSPLF